MDAGYICYLRRLNGVIFWGVGEGGLTVCVCNGERVGWGSVDRLTIQDEIWDRLTEVSFYNFGFSVFIAACFNHLFTDSVLHLIYDKWKNKTKWQLTSALPKLWNSICVWSFGFESLCTKIHVFVLCCVVTEDWRDGEAGGWSDQQNTWVPSA